MFNLKIIQLKTGLHCRKARSENRENLGHINFSDRTRIYLINFICINIRNIHYRKIQKEISRQKYIKFIYFYIINRERPMVPSGSAGRTRKRTRFSCDPQTRIQIINFLIFGNQILVYKFRRKTLLEFESNIYLQDLLCVH